MTTCDDDAMTTKRWALLRPPDEFDVADAKWTPACELASRGARGGAPGGQTGDVFFDRLIVQLGSRVFFDDAMCVLAHIITSPKCMVHPPCKYLRRLIRGRGMNAMVPSELTTVEHAVVVTRSNRIYKKDRSYVRPIFSIRAIFLRLWVVLMPWLSSYLQSRFQ